MIQEKVQEIRISPHLFSKTLLVVKPEDIVVSMELLSESFHLLAVSLLESSTLVL